MLDEDLHERGHAGSHSTGIQHRDHAADEPAALELPQPLVDGGRGQPDPPGDLGLGHAAVALNEVEDEPVPRIERLEDVCCGRHGLESYSVRSALVYRIVRKTPAVSERR